MFFCYCQIEGEGEGQKFRLQETPVTTFLVNGLL